MSIIYSKPNYDETGLYPGHEVIQSRTSFDELNRLVLSLFNEHAFKSKIEEKLKNSSNCEIEATLTPHSIKWKIGTDWQEEVNFSQFEQKISKIFQEAFSIWSQKQVEDESECKTLRLESEQIRARVDNQESSKSVITITKPNMDLIPKTEQTNFVFTEAEKLAIQLLIGFSIVTQANQSLESVLFETRTLGWVDTPKLIENLSRGNLDHSDVIKINENLAQYLKNPQLISQSTENQIDGVLSRHLIPSLRSDLKPQNDRTLSLETIFFETPLGLLPGPSFIEKLLSSQFQEQDLIRILGHLSEKNANLNEEAKQFGKPHQTAVIQSKPIISENIDDVSSRQDQLGIQLLLAILILLKFDPSLETVSFETTNSEWIQTPDLISKLYNKELPVSDLLELSGNLAQYLKNSQKISKSDQKQIDTHSSTQLILSPNHGHEEQIELISKDNSNLLKNLFFPKSIALSSRSIVIGNLPISLSPKQNLMPRSKVADPSKSLISKNDVKVIFPISHDKKQENRDRKDLNSKGRSNLLKNTSFQTSLGLLPGPLFIQNLLSSKIPNQDFIGIISSLSEKNADSRKKSNESNQTNRDSKLLTQETLAAIRINMIGYYAINQTGLVQKYVPFVTMHMMFDSPLLRPFLDKISRSKPNITTLKSIKRF